MRAALAGVDVVGEGEHALLVAVVVLERDLDLDVVLLPLEEEHFRVDRRLVLVQVFDELDDAALVEEGVARPVALVLDDDLESLVEERELAQTVRERVEGEHGLLEDLAVRLEAHDGPVLRGLLPHGELAGGHPALVALRPHVALATDLDLEPLRQRVDHRDADAVESARDLVSGVLELAARVQHGEHDLGGRLAALLVDVDWNAAPVVAHRAGSVRVEDDLDAVAVAGQRLVHRVVDRLVDQVVQAVRAGVADVHGGALADRLQPLEDLDVARGVGVAHQAAPRTLPRVGSVTRPSLTSHHVTRRVSGSVASAVVRKTCPAPATCSIRRACTWGSSSESASSSSSTGALPTARATGPASARRRVSAISRCCPREPSRRRARSSTSISSSSRCGPTIVWPRRASSAKCASNAARTSASIASTGSPPQYRRV